MSAKELLSIFAMQGFNGLSNFCVLLLMALGLAIIFGQMGVINMAQGEFMTIGAYTTYVLSEISQRWAHWLHNSYFIIAMAVAFLVSAVVGWVVERFMVSKLYKRPLDTLLATWGLSLIMQQIFRSLFGAKEVSAVLPEWLMGSFKPTDSIDIPINGVMVMVVTALLTTGLFVLLFRTRMGVRIRATTQNRIIAGACGINTRKIDSWAFATGCGLAGIAGASFTTIGSTGPTSGSLYIVDTFLVVVFGGAQSLIGTIASAFGIAQTQATTEFFLTGSTAKVLTLTAVVIILMIRPQGLFAVRVRR